MPWQMSRRSGASAWTRWTGCTPGGSSASPPCIRNTWPTRPAHAARAQKGARMTSDAAIEVQALRKRFGEVVALDGLDLIAPEGSVLALLGPNGAGKTTLVRALATLLVP